MFCGECNKRQATVHITKITNGEILKLNLCEECAHQLKHLHISVPQLGVFEILGGLIPKEFFAAQLVRSINDHQPECPKCRLTYEQFARTGRFGCSSCFDTFAEGLDSVIKKVQGAIEHTGKLPERSGGMLKTKKEIRMLRVQMNEAVSREQFEEAAQLRDQIRDLEQKLGGE